MSARVRVALALGLALVAGLIAPQQPEPAAEVCTLQGWPGGNYSYCVGDDPTLVAKTWVVPDGTVDYHLCAAPARYGQLLRLRPVWYDIKTHEVRPMPEGELWIFTPTVAQSCDRRRFAAAWPGGLWGPDLDLLESWRVWLPLVER